MNEITNKTREIAAPDAPATKRQTWALFCATKKDYRNAGLTRAQASALLEEANRARTAGGKDKDKKAAGTLRERLKEYVVARIGEVAGACGEERKMRGAVTLEGGGSAKTYAFFGGGCGITWFKYDGRSRKAKEIDKAFHDLMPVFERAFLSKFPPEVIREHDRLGFPIGAMFQQNLQTRLALYAIGRDFATNEEGLSKFRVDYMYD